MSTFVADATLILAGLDLAVCEGSVMAEASREGEELLRASVASVRR